MVRERSLSTIVIFFSVSLRASPLSWSTERLEGNEYIFGTKDALVEFFSGLPLIWVGGFVCGINTNNGSTFHMGLPKSGIEICDSVCCWQHHLWSDNLTGLAYGRLSTVELIPGLILGRYRLRNRIDLWVHDHLPNIETPQSHAAHHQLTMLKGWCVWCRSKIYLAEAEASDCQTACSHENMFGSTSGGFRLHCSYFNCCLLCLHSPSR